MNVKSKFTKWLQKNPKIKKKYKTSKKFIKTIWNSAIQHAVEKAEASNDYDLIDNIKSLKIK